MGALVQHNANAGGASTIKYAGVQTAGNFNIVGVVTATGVTLTGVSDSANGAYTLAATFTTTHLITNAILSVYYRNNIAAASANGNTVTEAGVAAASVFDLWAVEFSGMGAAAFVDTTATGGAAAAPASVNITPTSADLIFAIVAASAGATGTLTNLTLLDSVNDVDYYHFTAGSGTITCADAGWSQSGMLAVAFTPAINITGLSGNILVAAPVPHIQFSASGSGVISLTNTGLVLAEGVTAPSGLIGFTAAGIGLIFQGPPTYFPVIVAVSGYYVTFSIYSTYNAIFLVAGIDYGWLLQSVVSGPYPDTYSAEAARIILGNPIYTL